MIGALAVDIATGVLAGMAGLIGTPTTEIRVTIVLALVPPRETGGQDRLGRLMMNVIGAQCL